MKQGLKDYKWVILLLVILVLVFAFDPDLSWTDFWKGNGYDTGYPETVRCKTW